MRRRRKRHESRPERCFSGGFVHATKGGKVSARGFRLFAVAAGGVRVYKRERSSLSVRPRCEDEFTFSRLMLWIFASSLFSTSSL